MLTLGGESLKFENFRDDSAFVVRLSDNENLPRPLRTSHAFLTKGLSQKTLPEGFRLYVKISDSPKTEEAMSSLFP